MFLSACHVPDALLGSRCRIAQSKVAKTDGCKIMQRTKFRSSGVHSGECETGQRKQMRRSATCLGNCKFCHFTWLQFQVEGVKP